MSDQTPQEYILGIDLGSNSLGWALIKTVDGKPLGFFDQDGVPALGARVYDAATAGDRESGKEKTKNVDRRDARHARRQTRRRTQRTRDVFLLLQRAELLPRDGMTSHVDRQKILENLDKAIFASDWFKGITSAHGHLEHTKRCSECHRLRQVMPYLLRASALNEKLEKHQLGRAFYHLAQRRGFLSNRKSAPKADDDEGKVYKGINALLRDMEAKQAKTTAEYFARFMSPLEERIRARWTSRKQMYEPEFDAIWETQAAYYPEILTPALYRKLRRLLYYQRPAWFDPGTLGQCELESGQYRAPMFLLTSQHFRVLEQVNRLRILPPGEPDRELTPDDRKKVIAELELKGDRTFDQIRSLLGLEKEYKFNLEPQKRNKRKKSTLAESEEGPEEEKSGTAKLKGNRTNAAFYKALGEHWLEITPGDRDAIVQYAYAFEKPEKLAQSAREQGLPLKSSRWQLESEAASDLSAIRFETRPASLSRKAMETLIPLIEEGKAYAQARRELYPEKFLSHEPLDLLPPVEFAADPGLFVRRPRKPYQSWLEKTKALPSGASLPPGLGRIRNPAVARSLTELRRVVNAIIARHGKPAEIHIELLRELKNPKSVRARLSEANLENKARRDQAKREIRDASGNEHPNNDEVRKVLLFKECKNVCAYCGQGFDGDGIYGSGGDIQIDHIIPRGLCPDNTFANLILCHARCNAEKGDRTPFQAFSKDRLADVIGRIRRFQGTAKWRKLRRASMDEDALQKFLDKFSERQLRDSAYAARVAAQYLGYLYGGTKDASGKLRIICTSGEATHELRKAWGLYGVLNDGPTEGGGAKKKNRDDHRHHAVDAVAIALTSPSTTKKLSDAFKRLPPGSERHAPPLESPWNNFVQTVRAEIDRVIVSHRVSRKVSGALHEDTNYSPPDGRAQPPLPPRVRRVLDPRLPGKRLGKSEVKKISDRSTRELVIHALHTQGTDDPAKAFSQPEDLPLLPNKNGPPVVVRKVRIDVPQPVFPVGEEPSRRYVTLDRNHHVELVVTLDDNDNPIDWDGRVVDRIKAADRIRRGGCVIDRSCATGERFEFSLCAGEVVMCNDVAPAIYLVFKGVSQYTAGPVVVSLARIDDAKSRLIRVVPSTLLGMWGARKVVVSPIGEVTEAHD